MLSLSAQRKIVGHPANLTEITNQSYRWRIMFHEYLDILTSPAHLMAELTIEFVSAFIGFLWGRKWLKKHDEEKHNVAQ